MWSLSPFSGGRLAEIWSPVANALTCMWLTLYSIPTTRSVIRATQSSREVRDALADQLLNDAQGPRMHCPNLRCGRLFFVFSFESSVAFLDTGWDTYIHKRRQRESLARDSLRKQSSIFTIRVIYIWNNTLNLIILFNAWKLCIILRRVFKRKNLSTYKPQAYAEQEVAKRHQYQPCPRWMDAFNAPLLQESFSSQVVVSYLIPYTIPLCNALVLKD